MLRVPASRRNRRQSQHADDHSKAFGKVYQMYFIFHLSEGYISKHFFNKHSFPAYRNLGVRSHEILYQSQSVGPAKLLDEVE